MSDAIGHRDDWNLVVREIASAADHLDNAARRIARIASEARTVANPSMYPLERSTAIGEMPNDLTRLVDVAVQVGKHAATCHQWADGTQAWLKGSEEDG